MNIRRHILLLALLSGAIQFSLPGLRFDASRASAQSYRDYIRRGNRQYRDSLYDKAQVQYQKGFERDSNSVQVLYNLGNSLLYQGQPKDAMQYYEKASKTEHNPVRRHQIFHNMGVILQSQKQFAPAIEAYKEALRCDPNDDESRYNLVLCQHQLKNNPDQQGDGQDDQKGDQQNKDQQQKQQQQQQKKDDKQEQQQQQQQQDNQMSKENAEQMLNAAMQNERQTQDKVKKQLQQGQQRRLQKQW